MRISKKWICLALGIILALAVALGLYFGFLFAWWKPSPPPPTYYINSVWEVDGCSFAVTDVCTADNYIPEGEETITPKAGYKFLVITCDTQPSGEVKVAEIRLKHYGTGFEANWSKGPFERNGQTDYVFSVLESLTEDEAMHKMEMSVTLLIGESRHSRVYYLCDRN